MNVIRLSKEDFIKDMATSGECEHWFSITKRNHKGEQIEFSISHCDGGSSKNSLPHLWFSQGCTDRLINKYLAVKTFVYTKDGGCYEKYNPMMAKGQRKINFEWLLEDTPENIRRLITEIGRRFFEEA